MVPRVAFLADTFHEVNGAARTSRELAAFAQRRGYPFLRVCFAKQPSNAFSPHRRRRTDNTFVIGYVGRLMIEKGVRFFEKLERFLEDHSVSDFRIELIGWGSQERWLRKRLRHARLRGILLGEPLWQAYADMDLFIFPSKTDTLGNVVQEALASCVPVLVTDGGGPKTIIEHGIDGLVSSTDEEMCEQALALLRDPERRAAMGKAGRARMLGRPWDDVFERVYSAYAEYRSY